MNNDPLITPTSQQLPPVTTVYPETSLPQERKEPNKFLKILGGVAGGALNLVAPGIGSMVGNLIGGGGGTFGSYGALYDQQRQQQQMIVTQRQDAFKLLGVQHRVSMQSQEFSTVSNLMKSRHDSEMTAVNNIKS